MKKIILITLILLSETLLANDFWQEDKQKHFAYSATIAGTSTAIARSYGSNKFEAFWIGFGSSIAVGILKEAVDGKGYGTEDIGDVYADFIGAGTGAFISTQYTWRF